MGPKSSRHQLLAAELCAPPPSARAGPQAPALASPCHGASTGPLGRCGRSGLGSGQSKALRNALRPNVVGSFHRPPSSTSNSCFCTRALGGGPTSKAMASPCCRIHHISLQTGTSAPCSPAPDHPQSCSPEVSSCDAERRALSAQASSAPPWPQAGGQRSPQGGHRARDCPWTQLHLPRRLSPSMKGVVPALSCKLSPSRCFALHHGRHALSFRAIVHSRG